ncbi:LysE family translocator [Duganella sp. BJB488]|uniref:LysE family translocator n=1 Tax=unclassified Duganella TaxID=2636909 RepID=UPI000E34371D|nr:MULTISPECIES: LysE family translocator [unclassified Duganella]RFP10304.1 LysE family translocator [Duganella sp. BJB489]RFP18101.1 LysE family translocator [Duganella sp. BJB488]RFP37858.1 LysE family translocator [Duganella sp. BJB480]
MTLSTWLLFLSVSLAAAFSPGPGVLMAISTATTMGARRAFYSSAGNALGVFIVATTAVAGLGLLLKTSALAFGALKVAGAAYLIYLGIKAWRHAGQVTETTESAATAAPAANAAGASRLSTFRSGLLVAVSNPKAILFFTAVFPQFMPPDHVDPVRFLLLTSTFTSCTLLSHFFYVACASWLKRSVKQSIARTRLAKRTTGVIFVGMGGALLTLTNSK